MKKNNQIMAIINSLAVGKARKSAGNLTFSVVKGRTIAREKPTVVANPRTPAQQAQRAKMKTLVAAYRVHGSRFKQLFTSLTGYGSAYNEFIKRNMGQSIPFDVTQSGAVEVCNGAVFGNGIFGPVAVTVLHETDGKFTFKVNDPALRNVVKVGDVLGVMYITSGSTIMKNHELVLTDTHVASIKNGEEINTTFSGTKDDSGCAYFYSPTNKTSSSPVWDYISENT